MNDIPKSVSAYMATIGAKGGKAAKGAKKKRCRAHYKRLGVLHKERAAKRKKEQT
jgi:hypothetical protein